MVNKITPIDDQDGKSVQSEKQGIVLQKRVGLISGISFIVGSMIGSGIFISPKGVTEGAGSVGLTLILWVICGLIALGGALSLAELGTFITKSGGEYTYILEGIGSAPAFLAVWSGTLLVKPAGLAIISLTCAEYILVLAFEDGCGGPPEVNKKCLAAAVIFLLTAINCISVKAAARVQIVFTIAKLLAIGIIIIGGFVRLGQKNTDILRSGFQGTTKNVGKIAIGLYNGLWSYDGWNNLNYVTEELKNPYKNLPKSIMIGIPLVIVCYILVNISYFTVMSPAELLDSPAVAVTWAETVIRPAKFLIPIFVAFSTFGAANGIMFGTSRLLNSAARNGHSLNILSMLHAKRLTPVPSLIFTAFLSLIYLIPGNVGSLISFFNFSAWIFYGLTMFTLLFLRWKKPDVYRPYKVPIPIPAFVLLASVFLVIVPIVDNPKLEFLYAALIILAGLFIYIPFCFLKKKLACMDVITRTLQLFFEVSPIEEN